MTYTDIELLRCARDAMAQRRSGVRAAGVDGEQVTDRRVGARGRRAGDLVLPALLSAALPAPLAGR